MTNNHVSILFVCHGNICRSPMAEFILKDMLQKHPLPFAVEVESAATSSEELGNPVYPPVRRILNSLGIDCSMKRARRLVPTDYDRFDVLIGMDHANVCNMRRFFSGDTKNKIRLLLEYAARPNEEVDDPWYSGDFTTARKDIVQGCSGIIERLMKNDAL